MNGLRLAPFISPAQVAEHFPSLSAYAVRKLVQDQPGLALPRTSPKAPLRIKTAVLLRDVLGLSEDDVRAIIDPTIPPRGHADVAVARKRAS